MTFGVALSKILNTAGLQSFGGMGMTEILRNPRESCGDGRLCCMVPVEMETDFVGPR